MSYKYHGFISYNSVELKKVKQLYEIIENTIGKGTIFFDKKIQNADTNEKKITKGLEESKNLILILTEVGTSDSFQDLELDYFFKQCYTRDKPNRKILVFRIGEFSDDLLPFTVKNIDYISCRRIRVTDEGIVRLCHLLQESKNETILLKNESTKIDISSIEGSIIVPEFKILRANTIEWYNNNCEDFLETWKDNIPHSIEEFLKTVKVFKKTPLILDAGSGPGHHSNYFTKNGCSVIGIDLANKMVELAEKNKINTRQKFYNIDFTKLHHIPNIKRNYFDGIWASGSFIHLNNTFLFAHLCNCKAYLKKGGILGVSFQINFSTRIDEDGRFFQLYKLSEIERVIKSVGFSNYKLLQDSENNQKKTKQKVKEWVCFICTN